MKRSSHACILALVCLVLFPLTDSRYFDVADAMGQQAARAGAQETDADSAQLREALIKASLVLKSAKEELKTVHVQHSGDPKTIVSGLYIEDVLTNIYSGKASLLSGLSRPNLAGVKAHVEEFYPKPNLTVVGSTAEPMRTGFQLRTLVSEESADEAFAEVNAYMNKIAAATVSPTVNLRVNTTEAPAYCKIWAAAGQPRDVTTNDVTENLYRGYYTYTVTKNDYKKIEGKIDLINENGTVLDCTMYKLTDRDGPYPCKLK